MTTPTIEIKQRLDAELAEIRNDPDLSDDAKRRYIAKAFEKAQADYREAIETQERETAERVSRAEREVMRIRYPKLTTDSEKAQLRAAYRSARETAVFAADFAEDEESRERELTQLLQRAELSGDPELADATFHLAAERGIGSVVEGYLASRPGQRRAYSEYTTAKEHAATVEREMGWAKSYSLQKPPELNTFVPAEAPE